VLDKSAGNHYPPGSAGNCNYKIAAFISIDVISISRLSFAFASALFARAFERSSEIASHRLNFMRVGGIVALRTVDDISSVPRVSVVLKGTSPPRLNRLNSQAGAVTFRGTCRACVRNGEHTGRSKREPSHGAHDVFDQIWYGNAARSSALENRSSARELARAFLL